jgi:protein CpxP
MTTRKKTGSLLLFAALLLSLATGAHAQNAPPPPPAPSQNPGPPDGPARMHPMGPMRPPMERAFRGGHGRWWDNPDIARNLGISDDQKSKMDDIFQQHRLKLIDLNASLQKEEAILDPLISADQPDEQKILAQIDRVAQARAELEKANARMLLGIRRTLTTDQWKKLKEEGPRRLRGDGPPPGPGARGMDE